MTGLGLALQPWPQSVCLSPASCPGLSWLPARQLRVWAALPRISPPETMFSEERGLLPDKPSLPLACTGANPQCQGDPSARASWLGASQALHMEGLGTQTTASKMHFSVTVGIFCPASQVAPRPSFPGPCCMCATLRTATTEPACRVLGAMPLLTGRVLL